MKKNRKIVLLLDDDLKRRLDQKKREGYTLNGFIRFTLERALKSPRRRRAA
jgi:hypothetical protein